MVDSLTLTVNNRLSRWLLFRHSRRQFLEGNKVWEKPPVYSLDEWLRQCWLNSWPDQYFLTDLQSRHLWQKIIREDAASNHFSLLHLQGAAQQAAEAYQLIQEYRLPGKPALFNSYTEETKAFHRWMTRYQQQLEEWRALDASQLLDAVTRCMKQGLIPLPGEIRLYGFDDITPQLQDWLDFLESRSIPVHFLPFKPEPVDPAALKEQITQKQATVQKFEDANDEVTQCARWIRSVYKDGETIGIVVPDLEQYRGILEREFKAELAPASVYPWVDTQAPFNISLGTPLSHEPMVHLALLLLSQDSLRVPLLTFSTLINTPFLDLPDNEANFRRQLDWDLRSRNITHVYVPHALSHEFKEKCPTLSEFFEKWKEKWIKKSSHEYPSEWANIISEFLREIQWPMDKKSWEELAEKKSAQTSHLYQTFKSWKDCLDKLSSLDQISNKITRQQAILHLSHIVDRPEFQTKTLEEPIQILGLLESAGMKFDHLWIMGCHADNLPAIPRPNPFLPFLSHQKPYNLPHSTAERELAFTEQTLFRLAHACRRMIFSFPAWKGESELVPSPLIAPWVKDPRAIRSENSSRLQDHPGFSVSLESLHDFAPIPVIEAEKASIRGGTGIIKHQALCPFQAFAVHRLNSEHKQFSELDMDEMARGSLVHKILELFWKQVQSSERLHTLHDSGELTAQLNDSIAEGLKMSGIDVYGQHTFFELEKERLHALLHDWMEKERERETFKISDLEREKALQLNGLTLQLKVDRIDELESGGTVIIDYKTGASHNLKHWIGERIEEPQLPLYSLIVPPDALAFAVVNKRKPGYLGLSMEGIVIPGLDSHINKKFPEVEHWDQLKEYWKSHLHRTAQEFLDGNLNIDPLHEKETCKLCDQKTLCRKTELLSRFEEEDA